MNLSPHLHLAIWNLGRNCCDSVSNPKSCCNRWKMQNAHLGAIGCILGEILCDRIMQHWQQNGPLKTVWRLVSKEEQQLLWTTNVDSEWAAYMPHGELCENRPHKIASGTLSSRYTKYKWGLRWHGSLQWNQTVSQ